MAGIDVTGGATVEERNQIRYDGVAAWLDASGYPLDQEVQGYALKERILSDLSSYETWEIS